METPAWIWYHWKSVVASGRAIHYEQPLFGSCHCFGRPLFFFPPSLNVGSPDSLTSAMRRLMQIVEPGVRLGTWQNIWSCAMYHVEPSLQLPSFIAISAGRPRIHDMLPIIPTIVRDHWVINSENPLDGIIGCALQLQRGHSKCLCLAAVPSSVALSSVVPYLGWSRHRPSVGLRARNPAPMVQYGCRSCGAAISAPCKFQMFQRLRSSGRPSFFSNASRKRSQRIVLKLILWQGCPSRWCNLGWAIPGRW